MLAPRDVRRRRILQLRSKVAIINGLRIFWVLVVLWYELGVFLWSVAWCRWPKQVDSTSLHVLLVADPQVPRPYTGWFPSLTWLKQYVVNHNLRKSWNAVKTLDPQVVVFLGDMLRQGSKIKEMLEYGEYFMRFQSIFSLDPAVSTYFIPGNRDVGLGSSRTFSAHARDRYEAYFGSTNQLVTVGNHTFVLLDAPALVEEDYRRHGAQVKFSDWLGVTGGSIDFVKSVATISHDLPVVLFTHIPLFRPEGASCGPHREQGNIHRGVGPNYQSLLGRETSNFLLENTLPAVVFSADDHDYCEYLHTIPVKDDESLSIPEITVRSFSMATRLSRPGFQLLSLFTPGGEERTQPSYAYTQCLLPDQSRIYTHGYTPLLLISLLLLLLVNLRRPRPLLLNRNHAWQDPVTSEKHASSSSEVSPTAPSPPASPIHYKPPRSHPQGLRSASTLTPNIYASQPVTPLGGPPLLSSSLRPSLVEDPEDGQDLLVWTAQNSTPKPSPYLQDDSHGLDSSYFLPSPGLKHVASPKKSIWLPTFASRQRLTVRPSYIIALSVPLLALGRILGFGGQRRARTWYGRFLQDSTQVGSLPTFVYVLISLWLSR